VGASGGQRSVEELGHGEEQEPDGQGHQCSLFARLALETDAQGVEPGVVTDRPRRPATDPEPVQDFGRVRQVGLEGGDGFAEQRDGGGVTVEEEGGVPESSAEVSRCRRRRRP
jgi:hypothetical protein